MPTEPTEAAHLTRRMLSVYPQADGGNGLDSDGYVAGLAATLVRFPIGVSKIVTSVERGVPSRQKHRPSVAEVVEACEAEQLRLENLRAAANWMNEERWRRQQEALKAPPPMSDEDREAMRERVADLAASVVRGTPRAEERRKSSAEYAGPAPEGTKLSDEAKKAVGL